MRKPDHRSIMRQRAGIQPRKVAAALELQAPGRATSTRAPRWQDRASRQAQAEQLKREPHCEICGDKGRVTEATEVDHRVPRHAGGSLTDPANLRSLCHACHVDVTLADRARRTGRPVRRRSPRVKGCDADGYPLDPDHWWNK
jgi:5-methylcytosine-specific restriction protein A